MNGHIARRRLYLVRHGHVSYFDAQGQPVDPRTVDLSPKGEDQAKALKDVLVGVTVDRAVSSDYPRTQQTLEIALSNPPKSGRVESVSDLREIRAGRLKSISGEEIGSKVVGAYRQALLADTGFLDGERWDDFSERVTGWFKGFLAEPDWDDAIIVSHDAVNRVILAWLASGDRSALPFLEQDPACLNIVDLDCLRCGAVENFYVRLLNFTPYNKVKAGGRNTVMEQIAESMRGM